MGASVHLAVTMWCATGEREGRSGHISYNCTRILGSSCLPNGLFLVLRGGPRASRMARQVLYH